MKIVGAQWPKTYQNIPSKLKDKLLPLTFLTNEKHCQFASTPGFQRQLFHISEYSSNPFAEQQESLLTLRGAQIRKGLCGESRIQDP